MHVVSALRDPLTRALCVEQRGTRASLAMDTLCGAVDSLVVSEAAPPAAADAEAAPPPSVPPSEPPPGGLVDTEAGVRQLAAWLMETKKTVAFDAEGVDLCRNGRLALVQLSDGEKTWLVDVVALGKVAFDDGGLKGVLESRDVLKVVYDGRGDADALFGQFGVRLQNCYDVQIASCKRQDSEQCSPDKFVHGLSKAMGVFLEGDSSRAAKIKTTKEAGLLAFAPEHGGSYQVWINRPLPQSLVDYATADVSLLIEMMDKWQRFSPVALNVAASAARIGRAVNGKKAAKGPRMALKDF